MSQSGFEADLRAMVARVYDRRAGLATQKVRQRVLQILEGERRRLVPLVVGVLVGVAISPFLGAPSILASLALLFVGAFASGVIAMQRAERVERSLDHISEARALVEQAWTSRPEIDADDRACLIRVMNLARSVSVLPGAREILLAEVSEARNRPTLAAWPFLRDLEDLLRTDGAALA